MQQDKLYFVVYMLCAGVFTVFGWWLSPVGFTQTPYAIMSPSMLGFVFFSFSAYVTAFAFFVCAFDHYSPHQWAGLNTHWQIRLKRFAACALFLGAGIYLLHHRNVKGWSAAFIVAVTVAGSVWCTRSRRFEQTTPKS